MHTPFFLLIWIISLNISNIVLSLQKTMIRTLSYPILRMKIIIFFSRRSEAANRRKRPTAAAAAPAYQTISHPPHHRRSLSLQPPPQNQRQQHHRGHTQPLYSHRPQGEDDIVFRAPVAKLQVAARAVSPPGAPLRILTYPGTVVLHTQQLSC